MKKILIIDENIDSVGGVEMVVSELANRLSIHNNVTVVSKAKTKEKPFFKYSDAVKRIYMLDERKNKSNSLSEKNLKYYFLRLRWKIKEKVIEFAIPKNIMQEIKETDVLIFSRINLFLKFQRALGKRKKDAKIIVRDALHFYSFSAKKREQLIYFLNEKIDYLIVSSEESIDEYSKQLKKDRRVTIKKIYNPLRAVEKNLPKQNIITWIGRLSEEKGVKYIVQAFSLFAQNTDWRLRIYGRGTAEKEIRNLVEELHLETQIEFKPFTKDVDQVLEESKIFVLASRTEGYANTLVEAMSHGCACVSFDWLMGIDDIIQNKKNGIIVPLKNRVEYHDTGKLSKIDVENLSCAIYNLIKHEELIKKLGDSARKIKSKRNNNKIIKQWEQIINE